MNRAPDHWEVVFEATEDKACRTRALVLTARGLPHVLLQQRGLYALAVPSGVAEEALRELSLYEQENPRKAKAFELPPPAPGARVATALYALLLTLYFLAQTRGLFDRSWVAAGAADAAAIRDGEWWRTATALFLHGDLPHLLGNIVWGSLFGYLVAHSLGGGLGWLAIFASGVLGNLTNAWIQEPSHVSIGASTAVFGAIGTMAGAEWRRRRLFRESRLRRAAPIVLAVVLLTQMGMNPELPDQPGTAPGTSYGNEGVDVLAHCTGLVWGLPLGYLASTWDAPAIARRSLQATAGMAALAAIALAWTKALG